MRRRRGAPRKRSARMRRANWARRKVEEDQKDMKGQRWEMGEKVDEAEDQKDKKDKNKEQKEKKDQKGEKGQKDEKNKNDEEDKKVDKNLHVMLEQRAAEHLSKYRAFVKLPTELKDLRTFKKHLRIT
eukprot:TRINITY_DN33295_c0_g1_i2.p2 TRINITY_DN33295_c0_g1~~TRINITY_DN33295_c0_g1_i2.p2  ORF type:complete len:128 (-),score=46.09 TRINITY_DN33295_c0_g1_i2:3-386(-)